MSKLVAILDGNKCLIGARRKAKIGKGDIVLPDDCDLAMDGRYKWDGKAFVPLGHGFGPVVARPPVSEAAVLYMLVEQLGDAAPAKAREWADWYASNLKQREMELARRSRKPRTER